MLKSAIKATVILLVISLIQLPDVFAQMDGKPAPTVTIENGSIEGIDDSGVAIFKGIPFAKPPVDELRWKAPEPMENWQGVRSAKLFGPRCMQLPIFGDMEFRSDGVSEDCLYLNVWSPTLDENANLPVLVYFYGGGFMAGDGSEFRYDGENMARTKGIVTVTVNYRLNVFGFMSHPELTEESPQNASGNYGLLDQSAALQWVKRNIQAFGGNPDMITIAGESAGSASVSAQMASPLSRDLIAGAVGESGSVLGALSAVPLNEGEKKGISFQQLMGASSLDELRNTEASVLLDSTASQNTPRFTPTVDGYFFPKKPVDIYRSGEQADVPLLAGWNSQEMTYQFLFQGKEPTPENYAAIVNNLYGEDAEKILELYPASTQEEVIQAATDLAGDRFIAYSTWKWSDVHSKTTDSPVYRYYYSRPRPHMRDNDANAQQPQAQGAVHSAEIEYVMGNLPSNKVYDWTPEDYQVSAIFQGFVANFIKTGNPNGLGLPHWSPFTQGDTKNVMHIDVETRLREANYEDRYEFLDTLYYPESE